MKARLVESGPMTVDGVFIPRLYTYRIQRANGWTSYGPPHPDPDMARVIGIITARRTYRERTRSH